MTAYRFCRSDDVPLIVEAFHHCNAGAGAVPWRLTADHLKRLGREADLWTSSCMIALADSEPIGVLIAAKREPVANLVLHVAVHPDHRRQGHGRHMMASLRKKMAILEPTLMLAEVPGGAVSAHRFLAACGFAERDVLTDYTFTVEAPRDVPGAELVADVSAPEIVADGELQAAGDPDRCWQRAPQSLRNLRDRPHGLAIATDRGIEAYLLHRDRADADDPLPFFGAQPTAPDAAGVTPPAAPVEILALGGRTPVPALLRPLLAVAAERTGRALHLPRAHSSEAPADRLEEIGFAPGGSTTRLSADAGRG